MRVKKLLDRRNFLGAAIATLAGAAVGVLLRRAGAPAVSSTGEHDDHSTASESQGSNPSEGVQVAGLARWSDPATWGGAVPARGAEVVVSRPILLDVDVLVARLLIGPGASLTFDSRMSRTLRSRGNIEVRGRLVARPSSPSVVHKISFTDIDEKRFVGGIAHGGFGVLDSDVGLWVVADGVLDAVGSPKRAWTRARSTIPRGARTVSLTEPPTGWRVGDEIAITPTLRADAKNQSTAYDTTTISRIDGRTITLRTPTRMAHPAVTVDRGSTLTAEVLNLTRNVRIEGTPRGRTHVWISSRRQAIRYVTIRHAGPRKTEGVLGRYPLHFHMAGDGTRGSLVEGVVVRDSGHHGFVPHTSHGITFRDCITHNTADDAYWWDPGLQMATKDIVFDRCVASLVTSDRGVRLAGFLLGPGGGSSIRDCVAVGVQGRADAGGFVWPSQEANNIRRREVDTVWRFTNCLSHNNKENGLVFWLKDSRPHVIAKFIGYHNGAAGIENVAYRNAMRAEASILYGNGKAGGEIHALSGRGTSRFVDVIFDGGGLSDYAVVTGTHVQPPLRPTEFVRCTFRGYRKGAALFIGRGDKKPELFDFVDCSFAGNEMWLDDSIHRQSVIRIQDARHGFLQALPAGQPGTYRKQWNASVSSIAPFA